MSYHGVSPIRLEIAHSCAIANTLFAGLSTDQYGGAIYLSNHDIEIAIYYSSFIDNKSTGEQKEAGSLFIENALNATLKCNTIEKNTAYWSVSFFITIRQNKYPVTMTQLSESGAYNLYNHQTSHLDILGGDPLSFHHVNFSANSVDKHGFFIDYCTPQEHDFISYITFANQMSLTYFQFDMLSVPNSIFYDKINLINITSTYFTSSDCRDVTPEFFQSNLIFDNEPEFCHQIFFHDCYFSKQIASNNNVIVSRTTLETNYINVNTKSCQLITIISCPEKYKNSYNMLSFYIQFFQVIIISL